MRTGEDSVKTPQLLAKTTAFCLAKLQLEKLLHVASSNVQPLKLKHQLTAIGAGQEGCRAVLLAGIAIRLVVGAYASHPAVWENISAVDVVVLDGFNPFSWIRSFGASFYLIYIPLYAPVLLLSALGLNQQFITLMAFKIPAIMGDVITFYSLLALGRLINGHRAMLLASIYFLNPYAIFLSAYTGHFDQLMISLVLAGVYSIVARKPALAALCLGLSVFFRYVPILFLPAFIVMCHHFVGKRGMLRFVALFLGIASALAIPQVWTTYVIYSSSVQGFWAFLLGGVAMGTYVGNLQVELLSYNFTGAIALLKLDWIFFPLLGWKSFLIIYVLVTLAFVLKRSSNLLRRVCSYAIVVFTSFILLFPMAQHHYLAWILPFVLMDVILFGSIAPNVCTVLWLSNLFIDPIVWGNFRYTLPLLLRLIPWLNYWPSSLAMRQAFGFVHASSLLLIGGVSLGVLAPRINLLELKRVLPRLERIFLILIAGSFVSLILGEAGAGARIGAYSVSVFCLFVASMLVATTRSKSQWGNIATTTAVVIAGFVIFSSWSSIWLLIPFVASVVSWMCLIHEKRPHEMPSLLEKLISRIRNMNVREIRGMIILSILALSALAIGAPNPQASAYYHWTQQFDFPGAKQGFAFGEVKDTILSDDHPSGEWTFHIYILDFVTPEMRKAGDFWLYIAEPNPSGEGRVQADVFVNDVRVSSIDTSRSTLTTDDSRERLVYDQDRVWLMIRLDPNIPRVESSARIVVYHGTMWNVRIMKIRLEVSPLLLEPPYWSVLLGRHRLVVVAILTVAEVLLFLLLVRRLACAIRAQMHLKTSEPVMVIRESGGQQTSAQTRNA